MSCIAALLLLILPFQAFAEGEAPAWDPLRIIGSKHDLTQLNARAGVEAMGGVAFTDYQNPCIYCHVPEGSSEPEASAQIPGWNRIRPVTANYQLYDSPTLDAKAGRPNDISLLCLSCHDGSMAVDRVAHRPPLWESGDQATLHMRLNVDDNLESCGKCHDGDVAHDMRASSLGTNLSDDHPISIRYLGLDLDFANFRPTDSPRGFDNGVRLFNGNIECATCHDVHTPEAPMLLRTHSETLCITCHTN